MKIHINSIRALTWPSSSRFLQPRWVRGFFLGFAITGYKLRFACPSCAAPCSCLRPSWCCSDNVVLLHSNILPGSLLLCGCSESREAINSILQYCNGHFIKVSSFVADQQKVIINIFCCSRKGTTALIRGIQTSESFFFRNV